MAAGRGPPERMQQILSALVFIRNLMFRGLTAANYARLARFVLLRFVLRRRVPFAALCCLTYDCMCRCVHCYAAGYSLKAPLLTTAEWKGLLDQLAAWGVVKATFFGGEPLLRGDVLELIAYATSKGLRTSLDTNGLLLDEKTVLALKKAGLGHVNVSIDSVTAATHDALRGKPGLFAAATGGLRLCARHGLPCQMSIYASHRAIGDGDLDRMGALGRELGVSGVKVMLPRILGRWRGQAQELLTPEEEARVLSVIDGRFVVKDPPMVFRTSLLKMLAAKGRGCASREANYFYIAADGELQPCPVIPVGFGNVRAAPLRELAERMLEHPFVRRDIKEGGCFINNPEFQERIREVERFPVSVDDLPAAAREAGR